MTTAETDAPERSTVTEMAASLSSMHERLTELVHRDALTQDDMVEIISIYNNVAYIFLYLEAVDDDLAFDRLKPWRADFYDDLAMQDRLLELLLALDCSDAEAETSRLRYIEQLRRMRSHDRQTARRIETLVEQAKTVLDDGDRDERALLARLGERGEAVRAPVLYFQLITRTADPAVRQKLARAWAIQRGRRAPALTGIVDAMVDLRRARSTAEGHASVLAQTMERCRIGEDEVRAGLDAFLDRAVTATAALHAEIRDLVGPVEDPLAHFEYVMARATRSLRPPVFVLDACLDFIFAVTQAVFGLTIERVGDRETDMITLRATRDGTEVGEIRLDLWATDRKPPGPNRTVGIRNRTEWNGLRQLPVAYVSCRFDRGAAGAERITFQNVHSLFHEFGHAVNHLLVRKRVSNQSGLEYLPPERLEHMSMWYEKWAYHPDFRALVLPPDGDVAALDRAEKMFKLEFRRTYMERAVLAALDFDLHRRGSGGLEQSYADLDARFGVSRYLPFEELPEYFTWPMYVAYPGANFAYVWGSADSCEKFEPFRSRPVAELAAVPGRSGMFDACFDFDQPTATPDMAPVFAFYDDARLSDLLS